jgi:kynureninase
LSERRQILILVAITAVIAIAGTQLGPLIGAAEGEAVVTQYTAVFHADGRLE